MVHLFIVLNGKKLCRSSLFGLIAALGCVIILLTGGRERQIMPVSATDDAASCATLVIDPGHGGEDGGAVAADGTKESHLNWQIACRLKALADWLGVPSVMTRDSEEIIYPDSAGSTSARKIWDTRTRVETVNAIPEAVLVSIHQNKYPSAPSPRGAQVLYARGEDSHRLGEITHANLVAQLWPENRRVAAPAGKGIYLMQHISCPAILVECGFLSNPEETALLQTESYQSKLAVVLLASFLQYENLPPEVGI